MKCPSCGTSGFSAGTACWSCGKGGTTRAPSTEDSLRVRGGGVRPRGTSNRGGK